MNMLSISSCWRRQGDGDQQRDGWRRRLQAAIRETGGMPSRPSLRALFEAWWEGEAHEKRLYDATPKYTIKGASPLADYCAASAQKMAPGEFVFRCERRRYACRWR